VLDIPSRPPRARVSYFMRALASAVVAAAAVAVGLSLRPAPRQQVDPQVVAAAQDLTTAMHYLQKSAVITQRHVESAVGTGLRDAFVASRDALAKDTKETGG
jgi:hypothetical protein